jgi:hypothetical protein
LIESFDKKEQSFNEVVDKKQNIEENANVGNVLKNDNVNADFDL